MFIRKFLYLYVLFFVVLFIFGGFYIGNKNQSKISVDLTPAPSKFQINSNKTLAKVIWVVDGDTIKVSINGKEDTVRLIGIDSPEVLDARKPEQCFGKEASNKAKEILMDKTILLESDSTQADRDEYGRLLRYVFLQDGTNFDKFMISEGFAREYTFKNSPYRYQLEFIQAQKKAKEENKGLWGLCKN